MPKLKKSDYYNECEDEEDDELINRENVWHFYAYFSSIAAQLLREFLEIADIPDNPRGMVIDVIPTVATGKKNFKKMMDSLHMLIKYYRDGELRYYGKLINFENGDMIHSLTDGLHQLMNILPYLNSRHYSLSQERYDEIKYHRYSYDELNNLDRTLAKIIFPTFLWFANHSIFSPRYFKSIYNYSRPRDYKQSAYNCHDQWHKALDAMVKSWEWLKDRKVTQHTDDWEDIPDKVYYGLHLFAEYLPEMQND